MKRKYLFTLISSLILPLVLCTEAFGASTLAKEKTINSALPRVLLLDLGGLFYKFSAVCYIQELGLINIISYAVRDFKNPGKVEQLIFKLLNSISEDEIRQNSDDFAQTLLYKKLQKQRSNEKIEAPHITSTRSTSGRELSYIISAYQAGHISDTAAKALAYSKLEKYKAEGYGQGHFFASEREANLVADAIRLIFTPEVNAKMNVELAGGIKLLQELAVSQNVEEGTRKFDLVALSNADKRVARILEKLYKKNVFGKFQRLFYSGDLGTVKPNNEAYTLVLEELNALPEFSEHPLTFSDIVFMDDQPENIEAAKRVGIQKAILYKNADQAREELVKFGLLAPKVESPSAISLTHSLIAGGIALGSAYLAYYYCN